VPSSWSSDLPLTKPFGDARGVNPEVQREANVLGGVGAAFLKIRHTPVPGLTQIERRADFDKPARLERWGDSLAQNTLEGFGGIHAGFPGRQSYSIVTDSHSTGLVMN
jgi:hypothetical protein